MIDLDLIVQTLKDNSAAGMVLAMFIGIARIISAVNEGRASKERITQLEKDLSSTKADVEEAAKKIEDMQAKMEQAFNERHDYIARYNEARVYAIFLENTYDHKPRKEWT